MLGIRITRNSLTNEVHNRPFHDECVKKLNSAGFFESQGVWRHLDGRIAGIFSLCPSYDLYNRTVKPIKKRRSVLDSLVGK